MQPGAMKLSRELTSIKGCPKVEEEHRSDTSARERLGCLCVDRDAGDIASNDPHADTATSSTDQEEVASAQSIDEEEEPDESEGGLDNTKDTSGQE